MPIVDVAAVRAALGLTQVELAAVLDVQALTVSRWERGASQPRVRAAALLAAAGRVVNPAAVGDAVRAALALRGAPVAAREFSIAVVGEGRP